MGKKPKTLAEHFGVDQANFKLINPSDFAHIVVDVQRRYADPNYKIPYTYVLPQKRGSMHTWDVTRKLKGLMEPFRETGANTVIVYTDPDNEGYKHSRGGPFLIEAKEQDLKIPKTAQSGFHETMLQSKLEALGAKYLLISGFNARACVLETVKDAISNKFKVVVIKDTTGQDLAGQTNPPSKTMQTAFEDLRKAGAYTATSDEVLEFFSHLQAA